jgi:hypothetical protein
MHTSFFITAILLLGSTTATPLPSFITSLFKRTLGEGYTSCTTNTDCTDSMVCESGFCTVAATNPLCGWEGHCEGDSCTVDTECDTSLSCIDSFCVLNAAPSDNSTLTEYEYVTATESATDTPCETPEPTEPIVQVPPPTTTEEVVTTTSSEVPCETPEPTEPIVQVPPPTTTEEVPCETPEPTEPIVQVPPPTTTEEVPCETPEPTEPIVQVPPPTTTEEVPCETPEPTEPIVQVPPPTTEVVPTETPCETDIIVQVPPPTTIEVVPTETPCEPEIVEVPQPSTTVEEVPCETEPVVKVEACPPQETVTETLVQVVTEYKIMTKTVTLATVPTETPYEEVEVIVEECDETPTPTPIPTEEPCYHCPPVITSPASSTVPILLSSTSEVVIPTGVPVIIPIISGFSGSVTYFNDTQFQCVSEAPSDNALAINPKLLGFTEEDWTTLWQNIGPVESNQIPWCGRQLTLIVGDKSFTGTVIHTCYPTGNEFTDPVTGQTIGGKCDYPDAIELYGANGLAFLQDITGDDLYQGELSWSLE